MNELYINFIKIYAIVLLIVILLYIIARIAAYYSLYYQDRHKVIMVNYYDALKILQNQMKHIKSDKIKCESGLFCGSIKVEASEYRYIYKLRIKGCIITMEDCKVYLYPFSCIRFTIFLHKINKMIKNAKKNDIKQKHDSVYNKLQGGKY